ncbi:hypothetical protein Tco_0810857, partial [Tanacetum coccineum]
VITEMISAVSVGINLTHETSKSASEEQYLNKVNPEVSRNVKSSDVVQKSHEDVLNDALEECEQMTPADADIYSKPKTDKMLDVVVKPKPKLKIASISDECCRRLFRYFERQPILKSREGYRENPTAANALFVAPKCWCG